MSSYLVPALHLSNLDRIISTADPTLREDIFGEELPHTWCYYFERADLARQSQDWETINAFWQEADENGYTPAVLVEYRPFIEAAAYTGNIDQAVRLTDLANNGTLGMRNYLCSMWDKIELNSMNQAPAQVEDSLQCTTLDEENSTPQE